MTEQGFLEFVEASSEPGSLECLGLTFDSQDHRRSHFLGLLADKLKDPDFRATPGFPIASDEDILRLSDPPYYTACPNPFLEDLIGQVWQARDGSDDCYAREPLALDISEGKNDPIFNAHPYHTKVPPKVLLRLLLHYTRPGDIVLDPFGGSGMLGVAASLCRTADEYLGEETGNSGPRTAIISDLAPCATFIGNVNSNSTLSATSYPDLVDGILAQVQKELGWMYETDHVGKNGNVLEGAKGRILYTIWSEFYRCPDCPVEIEAWTTLVDRKNERILVEFRCPGCDAQLKKSDLERVTEQYHDVLLGKVGTRAKRKPVWVHYTVGTKRYEKPFGPSDYERLEKVTAALEKSNLQSEKMLFSDPPWGDFYRAGYHKGVTHAHHFFTERNYLTLWALRDAALASENPREMLYLLTAFLDNHASRRNRYLIDRHHPEGTTCGPLPNSMYIPELQCEVNPFNTWKKTSLKHQKMYQVSRDPHQAYFTTEASRFRRLPSDSIDYIFADPPFGKNILYAESSFLWEHFIGVYTSQAQEAIISKYQGKDLESYKSLIEQVFAQCFRILRPGRWMTVEFSNRSNAVWNAITSVIWSVGFVVADVRVLDKKQQTIRQDMGHSMKKDLIISCYKPLSGTDGTFRITDGSEDGMWRFVSDHLRHLPVFIGGNGSPEVVAERTPHMIFDRTVAYHVQRGLTIPMDSPQFFAGLDERFCWRDGMYYLQEQTLVYDKKRFQSGEPRQLTLFVTDEASATMWLRQQLQTKPQKLIDLQPEYLKQGHAWANHERALELKEILDLNFVCYDGNEPVPSQIRSYLSHFKELKNLGDEDPRLKESAFERWYVPDPKKKVDVEKLRSKTLLKEFEKYKTTGERIIKQFRTEAVRAGFKACYEQQDYGTIVSVAAKLPQTVVEEDQTLLMYRDVANMRLAK